MTGYYNTFVVKIWRDENEEAMRGNIQHVSSQERIYFKNLEDMMDFIRSHLTPPPDGTTMRDGWALLTEDFGDAG